jgi:hypothetical protein
VSRSNRHLAKVFGLRTCHVKRHTQILWLYALSRKGTIAAPHYPYGRRSGAASCLVSHSFVYFSGLLRIFRGQSLPRRNIGGIACDER